MTRSALASAEGREALGEARVAADTVLAVARADAAAADSATGRGVATAHETVATSTGLGKATVRRARAVLAALGLASTILKGRYMTTAEREQARRHHGGYQIRFASVRALLVPRRYAAVDHEHLPRRGENTPLSPCVALPNARSRARRGRSAAGPGRREAIPQRTRPLELQRLAAELDRRMPWLARGRHIGGLCDVLVEAGVDQDWSADDLLSHLDAENLQQGRLSLSPGAQRNPLGLLLSQLRRVVAGIEAPGARRRREAVELVERTRRRAEERERERQEVATSEQVAAHMARIRASLAAGRRRSCTHRPSRVRWAQDEPVGVSLPLQVDPQGSCTQSGTRTCTDTLDQVIHHVDVLSQETHRKRRDRLLFPDLSPRGTPQEQAITSHCPTLLLQEARKVFPCR